MWHKPYDLRKFNDLPEEGVKVEFIDGKSNVKVFVDKRFDADESVGDFNKFKEIFTDSYDTHEVYLATLPKALIGPRPMGLPRYWPIFFNDKYVWNILSEDAKSRLVNDKEIKRDGDLIVPLTDKKNIIKIKAKAVWLYTFYNIDHLYRETMPAIEALKVAGYDLSSLTFITPFIGSDILSILELSGVNPDNVISIGNAWIEVDELILPSFVTFGHLHTPSKWYLNSSQSLRSNLENSSSNIDNPKRLYVSRANALVRNIINEKELTSELIKRGFTIIEPGDFSKVKQIELFSNADIVVGPHGMGIANTIFCRELKLLVEIMATDLNKVSYFRNTQLQNSKYGCYWISPIKQPVSRKKKQEYIIDVPKFIRFLDETIINI